MRSAPDPSIRLRSRLLPGLVLVLLFLQLLDPFRGWTLLLVGLGGAWLSGYLWARSLRRSLHLTREKRFGWAQVGDRIEERFTLTNTGRLPALWVEIVDHSTLPGYLPGRVTGVGSGTWNRWRTQATCQQRGVYTLGPTTLSTADPLGLYSVEIHDLSQADLVVMPPLVPLPLIEIAPGGQAGEGRPRTDAPERTQAASSVRPLVMGDSLRWVHWRTTARRDQFYVRLFDSTPSSDWWIFLDLERSVQSGIGHANTVEHSVILAASLADRGLRQGRKVGLVAFGEQLVWLPPQEGGEHRWEILRALATVTTGQVSLAELLERIRPSIRQRASLVLITPDIEGNWLEALLPLSWRGSVPTILLLDPATFGGPLDNRAKLASLAENGIPAFSISRELLDRPEAMPGKAGRWEWRITPTGRAVAVRHPHDLDWKVLS
jgi:uncharacterized protein (DUF58 family)